MIIKVHSRGGGRGSGPVEYLLGKNGDREGATLDRGDPDQIRELIDSSPYARRYTSGVLSFQEEDLSRETKDKLMTEFEQTLLPGLDADQYAVLWVEHRDKGRLELNFVIPNIELLSGKRLQPYYHAADGKRINAWRTAINGELGLHDPYDPRNRQALTPPQDLPRSKLKAATAITDGLLGMAGAGLLETREDVLKALTDGGFDIVRVTKNSVSIADPEGGRNIRLKGVIYEQGFRHGEGLRAEIEAASERYRRDVENRVREARESCLKGTDIKREQHQKRHPRPPEADRLVAAQGVGPDAGWLPATSVRHERDPVVSGNDDRQAAGNIGRPEGAWRGDSIRKMHESPLHPDGRRGRKTRGRIQDTEGVLEDDRARTALVERLRGVAERARAAAESMARGLHRLAGYVRGYTEGQQRLEAGGIGLKQAGNELGRAGDALGRAGKQVDEIIRDQRREQHRDRGLSR